MSHKVLFIAAVFSIFLQSCRYSFDKMDMAFIDTYGANDTLVFESNAGKFDTIRITKKEIRYNGLSEGYAGNPEACYIYYQMIPPGKMELVGFGRQSGDVYSNEHLFLTAVKWKREKPATIEIKFDGFGGGIPKKAFTNPADHYDIVHFCKDCIGVDSTDVVKVKWKSGIGIVSYQRKDSTLWTLVKRY